MADDRAAQIFAALRAAAELPEQPFLVHVADPGERSRLVAALTGDARGGAPGRVSECASMSEALARLTQQRFELVLLDPDRDKLDVDALTAAQELGAAEDVVLLLDRDVNRAAQATLRGAPLILLRPLPENDALLRAHARWVTSSHVTRTRGAAVATAFARLRGELERVEPSLTATLAGLISDADLGLLPARISVIGDADLIAGIPATAAGDAALDVVVIGAEAADRIESRLALGRRSAPGAAVVVIDSAATPARAAAALYGGARIYLPRAHLGSIGKVLIATATRRRAEVLGRKLVEVLARFGAFDDPQSAPAPSRALDARLLAGVTGKSAAVVPSGHEVLVVDDEIVVLTVLREALRRGGYRVTTAASAEEAIALMQQKSFDLVLTDKNLTGASGIEVLRFARTLTPAPAVVLITGYSSYDSAVEALDIGALDYIEKPIRDVELLRQRIRRALSRRDEQMSRPPVAAQTSESKKSRVLLVEVDDEKRRLLLEFLSRAYDVVAVASGEEALARLKQERFEVVLADRNLPGMSGLRVIEQAQQLLPHCASVLYTAYPSFESVKDAFEVGADAFVVRPSEDLRVLEQKVAGALRGKGGIMLG